MVMRMLMSKNLLQFFFNGRITCPLDRHTGRIMSIQPEEAGLFKLAQYFLQYFTTVTIVQMDMRIASESYFCSFEQISTQLY